MLHYFLESCNYSFKLLDSFVYEKDTDTGKT